MRIPEAMKKTIAAQFYDKTVEVLSSEVSIDDEGGIIKGEALVVREFKGNVQFSNFALIQQEYGIDYQIDVVITTDDRNIKTGELLRNQGIRYVAKDVRPFDSHVLIVGALWQR